MKYQLIQFLDFSIIVSIVSDEVPKTGEKYIDGAYEMVSACKDAYCKRSI